jgi:6-phosphogluconolactonase (cycloisomerase 2 family)
MLRVSGGFVLALTAAVSLGTAGCGNSAAPTQSQAPSNLTYSTNPATYTRGIAITANTPSSSGGAVTGYAVSPALPAGLSLDASTGIISGTPTAVTAAANYTVTASNSVGSTTAVVSIAVNDAPPTNLSYSLNPATYTKGVAIAPNTPSNSGGSINSYAVTPPLPAGLSLDTSTGKITGTPTAITATGTYFVTGTNSVGSAQASISITVNDAAPSSLTYSTNPATYTKGTAIAPNSPRNTGGAVVSYSVAPALPAGLSLNTSSGVITGTPTSVAATASYVVTATNTGGSTTASVSITVNDLPPANLAYSSNPATYTKGVAIAPNTPSNTGGGVGTYAVAPALPAGLALNTTTGVIAGTPTAVTATSVYTVTATNSAGSTMASVSITINDAPPTSLTYSTNPATYTKGVSIAPNTPTNGGGAATSYAVAPALPAGLGLNPSTGVISGTPTAVAATATYLVTATNTAGSTQAGVILTVKDVAPTNLTYSANPVTYTKGVAIVFNTPSSSGGAVVSYSVAPALPAGLAFNTSSGVISGTPTVLAPVATYTVTATNSGGSTAASVSITVNDAAPTGLGYSVNPAVYTKGTAIASNTPSSGGGAVVSYSVAPALPAGLALNTSTGVIAGTPTAVAAAATYTVTATNTGGTITAGVSITVNDVAPTGLTYSANPALYTKGTAIASNTPSSGGGAVVSYAVAPALPAGLTLNLATGVITGTPTALAPAANYTVTATNSGGSTPATLSITVNDVAPTGLTYSANPALYTKGTAIASNTPSSGGGPVVSYAVAPALPAGLTLNLATGVIAGTPTAVTATASYVVTATNTGGSTPASVSITVKDVLPTRFAFVANINDNTVSSYTVDATTGQLRTNGYVVAGSNPRGVTVHPSGKFLYVANISSNNISAYTINASTGVLTAVGGSPFGAGSRPFSVAVDPSGKFAYAANFGSNDVSAYTIDATTGALTAVSGPNATAGTSPNAITVDPTGRFVYVTNNGSNSVSGYTINTGTGALTSVGPAVIAGTQPYSVAVDPSGRFVYVTNQISNDISAYSIGSTGALTAIGVALATGSGADFVTADPSGRFVYVVNFNVNTVSAYTIGSNGALTFIAAYGAGTNPIAVTVDAAGRFAYVSNATSNDVSVFSIDGTTGALTLAQTMNARADATSIALGQGALPVHYVPKFAYAANFGKNTISGYTVNATTGVLTGFGETTAVVGQTGPISVAVDPTGSFAFVANSTSNNVTTFTINASTGALTNAGMTSVVAGQTGQNSVAVDPSGKFVYVANSTSANVSAYTIGGGGVLSLIAAYGLGGTSAGAKSVTVDPTGRFVYVANATSGDVSTYSISLSPTAGALTLVGTTNTAAGTTPSSVTVDPTGRFAYVANGGSANISAYRISGSSGALTAIVGSPFGAGTTPSSVTVDPSGRFAYVANSGSADVWAYTVNATSGVLAGATPPTVGAGTSPDSVAVDPSGAFVYAANFGSATVSAYSIGSGGALTAAAGSPFAADTNPYSATVTGTIQ